VSVKIEEYLRGFEIATKRSKAIASSTEDSMTVKSLIKNICDKQALKLISLELNQNIANMVVRVDMDSLMSVVESIDRK
jgi:23S rRNA U2552 (ribose-2'-O)-methylase RlmE/FtsJ